MVRLKAEAGGVDARAGAGRPMSASSSPTSAPVARFCSICWLNAIKFTDRGGRVAVGASARGDTTHISVADTGLGIPADSLSRLGDPFFQVRNAYDRNFEGAGLGLSLVRGLVGLHGGALKVESLPGVGTRGYVRLPRVCRPDATTGAPAPLEAVARLSAAVDASTRPRPRRRELPEASARLRPDPAFAGRRRPAAGRKALGVVAAGLRVASAPRPARGMPSRWLRPPRGRHRRQRAGRCSTRAIRRRSRRRSAFAAAPSPPPPPPRRPRSIGRSDASVAVWRQPGYAGTGGRRRRDRSKSCAPRTNRRRRSGSPWRRPALVKLGYVVKADGEEERCDQSGAARFRARPRPAAPPTTFRPACSKR